MVVKTFDSRFSTPGTREVFSGGSWSITNSTNVLEGWQGSQDTVSHPRPYVTGGPWSLTREMRKSALGTGTHRITGYPYRDTKFRWFSPYDNGLAPSLLGSRTVADALADSNPSRPIVDLPVFFGELGDLPLLLRNVGRTVVDTVAKGNLSYQFGVAPLISDLKKLYDFQGAVEKRSQQLSAAYRAGGLSHRSTLGQGSYRDSEVYRGATYGVKLYTTSYGGIHKWCVVKWVPVINTGDHIPSLNEVRRKMIRVALGGTVDLATLWELLPWSWLIDWFSNVGAFLAARRNILGWVPGQCFTMTHTVLGVDHRIDLTGSSFKGTMTTPNFVRETKSRTVGVPVLPEAQLPILNLKQIGILASLAILRR